MIVALKPKLGMLALLLLLLLGACTANISGDEYTATTETDNIVATVTVPTVTATQMRQPPTATQGPTQTNTLILPTPVLPAFSGQDFFFGDFFFDRSALPGCELPCWQGLVVGESGSEDIQAMFDRTFGFNGTIDFFSEESEDDSIGGFFSGDGGIPNLKASGYQWFFNEQYDSFALTTWYSDRTSILNGVSFFFGTKDIEMDLSAQRILRELGTPSHILVSLGGTGSNTVGIVDLLILYDEGIGFEYINSIPVAIEKTPDNSISAEIAEVCLGSFSPGPEGNVSGKLFIIEPFESDLSDYTPLQQALVGDRIVLRNHIPAQDAFGMSLEEITELAVQEETPCLLTDVSK